MEKRESLESPETPSRAQGAGDLLGTPTGRRKRGGEQTQLAAPLGGPRAALAARLSVAPSSDLRQEVDSSLRRQEPTWETQAWDPPANITQDHGPCRLRPHPTQKPESTAQPPSPSPEQAWAPFPRRWEAMRGVALRAAFTCGPLWGAVSCRPGRPGWPGSPGASPPAVPGLVPSESGCQSSLGQPDG